MALTTLDPNTALIVIDLQKGIAGYKGPRAGFSFTEGCTDFPPELDQQPNDIVVRSA
jgi:hypothetical protein